MGRTQPHGIAGHHGPAAAPIFNATPGYVEGMFRARRAKAAQPAPRGAAHGQNGLAEPLRTKLWRGARFRRVRP